ncbi:MAG: flagellar export chaperone FlgN [Panacagrimonas sp.]
MTASPDSLPVAASASSDRFRANISAQLRIASELEALLGEERRGLIARDWPAVMRISEDKNRLVAQMQNLGRELDPLCAGHALREVLARLDLAHEHAQLLNIADRLQRANRESRSLLDHHQRRVGTALRLMNRGDGGNTYGRNGYAGIGRLSQRLAAA